MTLLSFRSYPLWLNLVILAGAAVAVWIAGTRLERYADQMVRRTRLKQAFAGMLLLASATSLPEVATTITACLIGNPTLALYNLVGGIAMQTAILAIADWRARERGALSFFTPNFALLVQGVGLVILLQIAIVGMTSGVHPSFGGIGLWAGLLLATYLVVLYLTYRYQGRPRWLAVPEDSLPQDEGEVRPSGAEEDQQQEHERRPAQSLGWLYALFAGVSLIVLAAGWTVAQVGDALAEQTGLGSSFVGATLVAIATSLPEVSTTVSAAQHGNYSLAFSNIFGSNAFMLALLFVADLFYRGGTVLQHAQRSAVLTTAVGALVTCVYLWGLLEREDRTILGIGWDSATVLLLYLGGLVLLYFQS